MNRSPIDMSKFLIGNNTELTQQHYKSVKRQTAVEREWYKTVDSFKDGRAIRSAFQKGKLVKISDSANYTPIMRFRNSNLVDQFPPYLTPNAARLLKDVSIIWREECVKQKLDHRIRLSVTSLVRSQTYQEELVRFGKLAMSDSPHTRGEAFDIDGCGYYFEQSPINPRQHDHSKWHATFKKVGADPKSGGWGDYQTYQPKVHAILEQVLEHLQMKRILHFVKEYPDTTNTCYHICRNPESSK